MNTIVSIAVSLSVVWSVVSSIIAKKKTLASKNAMFKVIQEVHPKAQITQKPVFTADPEDIRVEALRRRKRRTPVQAKRSATAQPSPTPRSTARVATSSRTSTTRTSASALSSRKIRPLKELHEEDCPVPPTQFERTRPPSTASQLAILLHNRRNLRTAIVLHEVLSKPLAYR